MKKIDSSIQLLQEVLLADYTTWKVGGTARWFIEPKADQMPDLMEWANTQGIKSYFIGRGSNILIDDEGLPGLVIVTCNSLTEICRENNLIVAESGAFLPHVSKFAAKHGFAGFEFLIGIPGTVGGALAMNAGLTVFRPREMVSVVENFDVLNADGSVETLTMQDINVGYRRTDLLNGERFVLRVRFRLEEEEDPAVVRRNTFEHLAERKRKQPLDKPTAGSTFKSVPGGKGAGWYIDQAGLKGLQIGKARVSSVHANWIENLGGATAKDIRQLIAHIQSKVEIQFGIHLSPEVHFLE
ncbi:UDP-N-acetylmuramate dehydrogenase [Oscillatoria sp. CS-180]|uniref:UDP-N-acetylmuramate dehydrogenase n=1 Tax=Oscillatoria sp. CS-180 TaxID=3021720 RepID=UPI00232D9473|nr:UDP-N-acetylmuramate dehydrogenase [Oscillatoria sp. CS-180]MDB9526435.1 UDP-N-acetylmuramate dehydrogenase [Oscillatoria sp. CS-180]